MRKFHGVIAVTALALGAALTLAAPASAATPNIQERGCSSATANWVRVRPQVHPDQCYGFQGVTAVDEWVWLIHSGNNFGWWEDGAGNWLPLPSCTAVTVNHGNSTFFVAAIEIDGWDSSGCTN